MSESTVTAEQTRRYVRAKNVRPEKRPKIGDGLPSLRPTMASIVDDDDTTKPLLGGSGADSDVHTLMCFIQELEPRDPMPTLTEPAVERAKKRPKAKAAAVTHKRRKYRLDNALSWAPALVCDVCVAILFVLGAHAGTPAFVRLLAKPQPAPVAQLASAPTERTETVASPTLPSHVVASTPAPTAAAPAEVTAKPKAASRPAPTRKAAVRSVDRRR